MCPDVETFAPIIAATFTLGAEEDAAHPAAKLRVPLADRALKQTNALLAVPAQLLELGTARITASQVLDLAGSPASDKARFQLAIRLAGTGFASDTRNTRCSSSATAVRAAVEHSRPP
jgi:exonuclease V gamma subunit